MPDHSGAALVESLAENAIACPFKASVAEVGLAPRTESVLFTRGYLLYSSADAYNDPAASVALGSW